MYLGVVGRLSPDVQHDAAFALAVGRFHLPQCINQMVSASQLPRKIVNLLYGKLIVNNKLTIFWVVDFPKLFHQYIVWDEI